MTLKIETVHWVNVGKHTHVYTQSLKVQTLTKQSVRTDFGGDNLLFLSLEGALYQTNLAPLLFVFWQHGALFFVNVTAKLDHCCTIVPSVLSEAGLPVTFFFLLTVCFQTASRDHCLKNVNLNFERWCKCAATAQAAAWLLYTKGMRERWLSVGWLYFFFLFLDRSLLCCWC